MFRDRGAARGHLRADVVVVPPVDDVAQVEHARERLGVEGPYEQMSGWSSKASVGVERHRGRGLKAGDPGRRETPGKVLKDRRSPRQRGRMGTGVT
eukprot:31046-Pelagococcus_subviridis.AAC.4